MYAPNLCIHLLKVIVLIHNLHIFMILHIINNVQQNFEEMSKVVDNYYKHIETGLPNQLTQQNNNNNTQGNNQSTTTTTTTSTTTSTRTNLKTSS
eukprot:UN02842